MDDELREEELFGINGGMQGNYQSDEDILKNLDQMIEGIIEKLKREQKEVNSRNVLYEINKAVPFVSQEIYQSVEEYVGKTR